MRIAVLFLVSLVIFSCSSTSDNSLSSDGMTGGGHWPADSASVLEAFTSAYRNYCADSSEAHIDSLLQRWSRAVQSSEQTDLDKNAQAALDVYKAVYQPLGFPDSVGSEWGDLYADADYLVVNCSFEYVVTSEFTENRYELKDTLDSGRFRYYRPQLNLAKPCLYLSYQIESAIQAFLGDELADPTSIMQPSSGAGETRRREEFLSSRIKLMHYHWSSGYHINSHPDITDIRINEDLDEAYVYFTLIYQGGFIRLVKEDGKWVTVDARLTWIT